MLQTAGEQVLPASEPSGLRESDVVASIRNRNNAGESPGRQLRRLDFSLAFDPIAAADDSQYASRLEPSVFDGSMTPIVLDVAPYVRGIVAYDLFLQKQRLKLSNLISQGGRGPKRMRTTRASLSALEGGTRSSTRKERWFKADMNTDWVMHSSGEGWTAAAEAISTPATRDSSRTPHSPAASYDGCDDGGEGSDDDLDELA